MTQRIQPPCDEGRKDQVRSYFGSFTASSISGIGSWIPALAPLQTGTIGTTCTGGIQDSKIQDCCAVFSWKLEYGARPGRPRFQEKTPQHCWIKESWIRPVQLVLVCTGAKACTQDPLGGAHPATNGRSATPAPRGFTVLVWWGSPSHKMLDPWGGGG